MLNYKKINKQLLQYDTTTVIIQIHINDIQRNRLIKHCQSLDQAQIFNGTIEKTMSNDDMIINIITQPQSVPYYGFNIMIGLDSFILDIKEDLTIYCQLNQFMNNDTMDNLLTNLLRIINKTLNVYSLQIKNKLINDITVTVSNQHLITLSSFEQIFNTIISIKPHGKRTMMIIHHTGLWFVHNNIYMLIIEPNDKINHLLHSFDVTIFDGYLIKPNNTSYDDFNYQYWYLCTDCLIFNKQDVRHLNYIERIDYAKVFSSLISTYINPQFITFSLQTTRYSQNVNQFYEYTYYLLQLAKKVNYNCIGLSFKSPNQYQSTFEWINPTLLTIHLKVENKQLLAFDKPLMKSFDGPDQISSFRWNKVTQELDQVKKVKQPDDYTTAIEKWNAMIDPIEEDDILGNSLNYFHYLASQLITQLLTMHIQPNDDILTIVQNNFLFDVILPEVDPKNIKTLNNITSPVDVIILTFLSNYWANEKSLNQLINQCHTYLKPNGKIIFFTLSADHFDYLIKNHPSITLGPLTLTNDQQIILTYNNQKKIENKVYLQDLTMGLKKHHINLMQLNRFESFNLPEPMKILSSLFCYGYYTNDY
jgi:hypothetical protein